MDFADRLKQLAEKIASQQNSVLTEEATKMAFITPFINALGYDASDPLEVVPEFTADIGSKKGEKVDYAIKKDNEVIIIIEAKCSTHDLKEEQATQLRRYFGVTETRVAILTNGIQYRFYSDLDKENIMDDRPFYEIDMRKMDDYAIKEIRRFSKDMYDPDEVLKKANALKYLNAIKAEIAIEIMEPTKEFVRLIAGRVYSGHKTNTIIERFRELIKSAFDEYIRRTIHERLQSALEKETDGSSDNLEIGERDDEKDDGIVTTEEEIQGYYIVRSIASEIVDPMRIVDRDVKTYFGILLDDNNRKAICRLHFNASQKYLGLFDESKDETKHHIGDVSDIYKYKKEILETIRRYEDVE